MARCTPAEALATRSRLIGAAVHAFSEQGVQATTLADVAARVHVTRGAVYWHFPDKAALVAEVVDRLRWPLDVRADMAAYRAHAQPLRLLREQLVRQVQACVADPLQWCVVQLVLRHCHAAELPADARERISRTQADAVRHIGQVLALAQARGQLRPGVDALQAAHSLHAASLGVLFQHAGEGVLGDVTALPLCLDWLLAGLALDAQPGF